VTQESEYHPSGPLAMAIALALIAGFIDAHIYVHVTPVFTANMSGNLIHLGVFTGLGHWRDAAASSVALLAFVTGVVCAVLHHNRQLRTEGFVKPDTLLAVEAVLLASLPLVVHLFGAHFSPEARLADYPVIGVAAFAMGLQAAALRRVGEIAVATTYGTGAIVRIGEKVALAARRADRPTAHRRRLTLMILLSVLVSYVGGAALAAYIGASPVLLLLPAGGLMVTAVFARRQTLEKELPSGE
jgi:uncharacterized membrane protein YoaK (UPF0700 family)